MKRYPKNWETIPVLVDTREQHPYEFTCEVVEKTLHTGDYSLYGYEHQIAIERKTKQDAYQSLGQGRKRFEREFERLAEIDRSYVIIECSMPNFMNAPSFTKMNPHAAINSLISWMVKYKVGVIWAGDRRHGQALTYRILEKFWRNLQ